MKKGNKKDKDERSEVKASLVEEWETFKQHFREEYPDGLPMLIAKKVVQVGDEKYVCIWEDLGPDGQDDEASAMISLDMHTSKRMREAILTAVWSYVRMKLGDGMSAIFTAILMVLKDKEEKTGEGREETQGDADSQ